ncbi:MAG: AraC family transcriptional regulator [Victivallaceae bacterium]
MEMTKICKEEIFAVKAGWVPGYLPDIYISGIGVFQSWGNFKSEQVPSAYSCHVITEGRGLMKINGVDYEAGAGSVIMFYPGNHIIYRDYPSSPWKYTWEMLKGKNLETALKLGGFSKDKPFMDLSSDSRLMKWLDVLTEKFTSGKYSEVYPISAVWELLTMTGKTEDAGAGKTCLAETCRLMIDKHKGAVLTVEQLASQLNVDRSTLYRTFREKFGLSPKQYLDNSRFAEAEALLAKSELSIKEIAFFCGFGDQYYFSTAFRRRFGVSPGKRRK